jgi:hypothetical protein
MMGMQRRLFAINVTFMQMHQSTIETRVCEMRWEHCEAWPCWCGEAQLISYTTICVAVHV